MHGYYMDVRLYRKAVSGEPTCTATTVHGREALQESSVR